MVNYSLAKCRTKAAYLAKLQQKGKIDLKKIKENFTVILETPILLVIKVESIHVVVHSYGELLFKNCEDVSLMENVAEKIYEVGLSE